MTPVERIARLVGLLDRVQKNAAAPRPTRGATPPLAPAAVAKSSPLAAPPPAPAPPPVPVAAAPAVPSPTPPPVAAGPAYPSAPPGLGLDAPGDAQSSPPPPAPPAQPALSSWPSEPVSAVQPRPSEAPEELDEDDLVEMTTLPPATAEERGTDPDLAVAVSSSDDVEISVEGEADEEQPPASSRRAILSDESDESDLIAETALDDEREVPVKTPPPESGPQEAALPLGGGALNDGRVPDVQQFEADMLGPPSMGPTAEQLGETIELEPARGPELEIDLSGAAQPPLPPEAPPEELEVSLPRSPMLSGTFDVGPSIPPIDISTKAEPLPTVPVGRLIQESPTSVEIRSTSADVTVRPTHGATDVARVTLAQVPTSRMFTDILDQSLAL